MSSVFTSRERKDYNQLNKMDRLTRLATKLTIVASIVTIIGLPLVYFQLKEFLDAKTNRSIDLLNNYELQLSMGANPGIRSALEDGRAILQEHGGRFTDNQLADYIDIYSSMLGYLYDNHIIDESVLCDEQCYYIESAFGNKEVATYIEQAQQSDPLTWSGLCAEAASLTKYDAAANGTSVSTTLRALKLCS